MSEVIVKVPQNADTRDCDFLAFSFGGKHSLDDFGIIRVSDGSDGYKESLAPQMQDITMDVPGGDGQYFFGTQHKAKVFNINFAFDSLTEEKLREMRAWFDGKEIKDLWFQEAPYKVYSAKVTGTPEIKAQVFSESGTRVYKGTGSVTFTCYSPYARTPDYVEQQNGVRLNGREPESYSGFCNRSEFLKVERDKNNIPTYKMPDGQLPTSFVANLSRVGFCTVIFYPNNAKKGQGPITLVIPSESVITFDNKGGVDIKYNNTELFSDSEIFTSPIETEVLTGWDYVDYNAAGTEVEKTNSTESVIVKRSMNFYAHWSTQYTVTFYKALNSGAKGAYEKINGSASDWQNHTGIQELYGVSIEVEKDVFNKVDTGHYRGEFSKKPTGSIQVFAGTRLRLWVQNNPELNHTTCHLTVPSVYVPDGKNQDITKQETNPEVIITVTGNAHIVFEQVAEWGTRKVASWLPIYYPYVSSENWNCFVYASEPKITNGELQNGNNNL